MEGNKTSSACYGISFSLQHTLVDSTVQWEGVHCIHVIHKEGTPMYKNSLQQSVTGFQWKKLSNEAKRIKIEDTSCIFLVQISFVEPFQGWDSGSSTYGTKSGVDWISHCREFTCWTCFQADCTHKFSTPASLKYWVALLKNMDQTLTLSALRIATSERKNTSSATL